VIARAIGANHWTKCLGTAIALVVSVSSEGLTEPNEIVVTRQQEMKAIALAAKSIAGMFKSPETYSAQLFEDAAMTISERAGYRMINHFDNATASDGSKATKVIATDHDRFAELATDLKNYADNLIKAAEQHPGPMSEDMRMKKGEQMQGGILGSRYKPERSESEISAEHTFHMMLQTCSSCHTKFRSQ